MQIQQHALRRLHGLEHIEPLARMRAIGHIGQGRLPGRQFTLPLTLGIEFLLLGQQCLIATLQIDLLVAVMEPAAPLLAGIFFYQLIVSGKTLEFSSAD